MASTNTPVPGTGPDTTLNLSDPTTWIMIITTLGAAIAAAWPGNGVSSNIQTIAPIAAALIVSTGIFSKHHLAAAVAPAVAPAEPAQAAGGIAAIAAALSKAQADLANLQAAG